MKIVNRSWRSRPRLAFALAIIVSGCVQIVSLVEANSFAAVQFASSANDRQANQKGKQSGDQGSTRPRRAEAQTGFVQYASGGGPIIRVALMTDASSVSLSSSSGLIVRRATEDSDEGKNISSGSLTVELRQERAPAAPLQPSVAAYRVSVGSSTESRGARKLVDELKRKFFEPVAMSFDERQSAYSVLIGQFANRSEAAQFLERLRKSGYESLRIVAEQKTTAALASDSITDTNAQGAKYKAQPSSAVAARSNAKPDRRPIQLIALAADKLAASSQDELVISPATPKIFDRSQRPAPSEEDPSRKPVTRRDQSDSGGSDSGFASVPASVRIGAKDYRGEICLVLNPRGRINVVNALPLEEYLRGVVPLELSPGVYPEIEALKAQAVAARSYALARLGRRSDEGFDLVDDTRAQVYGGLSAERELTNRAIEETRGIAAVFPNDDGKLTPIEALYTANCGGRTENNEEVFGGKPLAYLRGVACSPDRLSFAGRDIVSNRTREALVGIDGRSIAREVALLSVLGFSIPRRTTSAYLSRPPDADEVRSWIEQTARLTQREKPSFTRGDVTRLAEFVRLAAVSVYGEARASTLLAPADVDYLLGGLRVQGLPSEARAEIAMLLKEGVLRLPADSAFDGRAQITRGQAVEILARVISMTSQPDNMRFQISDLRFQKLSSKSQISDSKSQISDSRSQISDSKSQNSDSKFQISDSKSQISDSRSQSSNSKSQISNLRIEILQSEIAAPSENGRLIVAGQGLTQELDPRAREKGMRFTSVNTSAPGTLTRAQQGEPAKSKTANAASKAAAPVMTKPGMARAPVMTTKPGMAAAPVMTTKPGMAAAPVMTTTPRMTAKPGMVGAPVMTVEREASRRNVLPAGLEVSEDAWLFRSLGGESHQVDRLTVIGGERVAYHLNAKGQVDFLEASISDRSASSDRFSSVAQWQERIPIEEMQQRLARARINVGRIEKIEPVSFSSSSRVTEVEVTGDERSARLGRPQIRAALGLKERLFVVDRETGARGEVVAFVFTGRGWGHGVGMCQTGAYGLAKEGYSYAAILQKYYAGVKVHKIY